MPEAPQAQPPYPSFVEARDAFFQSLAGKSARTVQTYATALRRFADFLDLHGTSPAGLNTDQLSEDALERFTTWLLRGDVDSRATVQTYVAGTRAFFRFLSRRKWLSPTVSFEAVKANVREVLGRANYRTPRIDRRLPLIVTYVESIPAPPPGLQQAHHQLELLRDRALIRTLFCTGIRRAEAAGLSRGDLDDGWATQALITGKGSKERVIFFDEDTLAAIRAYLEARNDTHAPAFLRHDRARGKPRPGGANYRLSPLSIWRIVKRYAKLAGVRATTHDFRHAKASTLLNRGAQLSEVQDLLGHASPETTKRIYAHYEVSHLREAFDRFSASPEELAAGLAARAPAAGRRPAPPENG